MLKTPSRLERRWDHWLNDANGFSLAAMIFAIVAVFPAVVLALLAQAAPVAGWLAISLALTVALMMRRPRG